MSFKIGDKVRIRKNSNFFKRNSLSPKDSVGIIINIDNKYIRVNWGGANWHNCLKRELEYWYLEPIRKLMGVIRKINNLPNVDYGMLGDLYYSKYRLTDEELQFCKDLWEKYN